MRGRVMGSHDKVAVILTGMLLEDRARRGARLLHEVATKRLDGASKRSPVGGHALVERDAPARPGIFRAIESRLVRVNRPCARQCSRLEENAAARATDAATASLCKPAAGSDGAVDGNGADSIEHDCAATSPGRRRGAGFSIRPKISWLANRAVWRRTASPATSTIRGAAGNRSRASGLETTAVHVDNCAGIDRYVAAGLEVEDVCLGRDILGMRKRRSGKNMNIARDNIVGKTVLEHELHRAFARTAADHKSVDVKRRIDRNRVSHTAICGIRDDNDFPLHRCGATRPHSSRLEVPAAAVPGIRHQCRLNKQGGNVKIFRRAEGDSCREGVRSVWNRSVPAVEPIVGIRRRRHGERSVNGEPIRADRRHGAARAGGNLTPDHPRRSPCPGDTNGIIAYGGLVQCVRSCKLSGLAHHPYVALQNFDCHLRTVAHFRNHNIFCGDRPGTGHKVVAAVRNCTSADLPSMANLSVHHRNIRTESRMVDRTVVLDLPALEHARRHTHRTDLRAVLERTAAAVLRTDANQIRRRIYAGRRYRVKEVGSVAIPARGVAVAYDRDILARVPLGNGAVRIWNLGICVPATAATVLDALDKRIRAVAATEIHVQLSTVIVAGEKPSRIRAGRNRRGGYHHFQRETLCEQRTHYRSGRGIEVNRAIRDPCVIAERRIGFLPGKIESTVNKVDPICRHRRCVRGIETGIVDAVKVGEKAGMLNVVAYTILSDVAQLRPQPFETHLVASGSVHVGEGSPLLDFDNRPLGIDAIPDFQCVADWRPHERTNRQIGGGEGLGVVHWVRSWRLHALQAVRVGRDDDNRIVRYGIAGGEVGSAGLVAIEASADFVPKPVLRLGSSRIRVGNRHAAGMEVANNHAVIVERETIDTGGNGAVVALIEPGRRVQEEHRQCQTRSKGLIRSVVNFRRSAAVHGHPEPAVLIADDAPAILIAYATDPAGIDCTTVQGPLVRIVNPNAES